MPGVSQDQLMRPIQIYKLVRTLYAQAAFFQNLLGLGPGSAPSIVTDQRTFGYDTYAMTRTLAPVTAPDAPPVPMGLKPTGQNTATLVRLHGFIQILENSLMGMRPPGGRLGEVDDRGKAYVGMQLTHLIESFKNSREFMISRMLRGGFSLKVDEDNGYRLYEKEDPNGTIQVNYNLPAENTADLGGIIGAGEGWDNAGAPIFKHFMDLSKRMARTTGMMPRHCILNSTTATPLFTNTTLRSIQGANYTIYNSFTQKPISPEDRNSSAVYTVVFGGLPQIKFHILNEGLVLNEVVPNLANQTSTTNFKLFVPDGKAIIIPQPTRAWMGTAVGREYIRENPSSSQLREIVGFGTWRTHEIDPARYDVKALDNVVPLLFMPGVVHFADVAAPYTSSEA